MSSVKANPLSVYWLCPWYRPKIRNQRVLKPHFRPDKSTSCGNFTSAVRRWYRSKLCKGHPALFANVAPYTSALSGSSCTEWDWSLPSLFYYGPDSLVAILTYCKLHPNHQNRQHFRMLYYLQHTCEPQQRISWKLAYLYSSDSKVRSLSFHDQGRPTQCRHLDRAKTLARRNRMNSSHLSSLVEFSLGTHLNSSWPWCSSRWC